MRFMPGEIIALVGRNNAYPLPKTSSDVTPAPQHIEKHFSFYNHPAKSDTIASFVQGTWNGLSQPPPRPLTQAGVACCQNEAWVVGALPLPTGKSFNTMVGSTLQRLTQDAAKRTSMGLASSLTMAVTTAACCMAAELGAVQLILAKEPDRLYDTVFFEFGITDSTSESKELCNALQKARILDAELYFHQPTHALSRLAALPPDVLGLTYRQHGNLEWFFSFALNNLRLTKNLF